MIGCKQGDSGLTGVFTFHYQHSHTDIRALLLDSNLMLLEEKSDKSKIEDYGTPEKFLEQVAFMFGKDSWACE